MANPIPDMLDRLVAVDVRNFKNDNPGWDEDDVQHVTRYSRNRYNGMPADALQSLWHQRIIAWNRLMFIQQVQVQNRDYQIIE